jgi:CHAD domain-containing protein
MAERIIEYFKKHRLLVEENFELSKDPNDIEAIHNMRLSIKRLRVLARLANMIDDGSFSAKERLEKINKLFKDSGRLRDAQLTRILLQELDHPELSAVIASFSAREAKQRAKYETALENFDNSCFDEFEAGLEKVLNNSNERQVMQAVYLLLSGLEMTIHELFHGSEHEKRMHEIRTRLKDIIYLNNIFDDELPISDQLNISIERLREVGELAGSWHDCLNLELKLGTYIGEMPSEAVSLQPIVTEIVARKNSLYQEYSCILINEMRI